jgi:hypothetical protein
VNPYRARAKDRAEQRRSDFENQRNELAKDRERALQLEQDKRAIKTDRVTRISDADGVSLDQAYVEWAAKGEALEGRKVQDTVGDVNLNSSGTRFAIS